MSRMKICMLALLLVTMVTSVHAQNFREWDQDQDGYITDYEFQVQLQTHKYFESFDLNTDGRINEQEWDATCKKCDFLVREYRRDWDINQDGFIHEDEFISGAYTAWDDDEDGYIANPEYEHSYTEWAIVK